MMPGRSLILGLALGGAMVSITVAQGVPVSDALRTLKVGTLAVLQGRIVDEAEIGNAGRSDMTALHREQLAAIDEAMASVNTSDFAPFEFEDLDGAPVAVAYDIAAVTGEESRLFGESRVTIEQMIVETVQRYQTHPALVRAGIAPVGFRAWFQALVKQESRFQIRVCSHKGACGLTQIMPGTFDQLGIPASQRNDPRVQLDGGARYLLMQLGTFGSMPLALAAYNAGPGAVHRYGGIPPYAETQDYVVKITSYANGYAASMGSPGDLGTLIAGEMALAELGNVADAGMELGFSMSNQLELSAHRIRALIAEIPGTSSTREAIDLNTYLRGEITRMAAMMTIMEASQRRIESQRFAVQIQAQIADEEFLTLTESGPTGG
jgi:hypothetical protein